MLVWREFDMSFSTSAKPLSYYVSDDRLFSELQERYGSRFEQMDCTSKLIFRASLTAYLVIRPIWDDASNSISCADCCIAGAGGDDYEIWDNNPLLVEYIQKACENLELDDIEGLIEALSAQLRYTREVSQ